jgi:hypothetical protein
MILDALLYGKIDHVAASAAAAAATRRI